MAYLHQRVETDVRGTATNACALSMAGCGELGYHALPVPASTPSTVCIQRQRPTLFTLNGHSTQMSNR
ncbi:MAG: hypothetical protein U1F04_05355 [Burkholderiaceae bacterium]|jgi:hypothetical protein